MNKDILRAIPPVDVVLGDQRLAGPRRQDPHFPWTQLIRDVVEEFRSGGRAGTVADRDKLTDLIVDRTLARLDELRSGGMRRVLNGTGVLLHTNLGRAIAGPDVRSAVCEALDHFVSLEIDLETGKRSSRGEVLLELIKLATTAEAAMVVNNNAAAVHIVIDTFSPPGRVIVSRGELVEIGGSFRLPDILEKAAGGVVEVGTTNRTYADDYGRAAREGDVILKVHRSNYDIRGFTHETSIGDLVTIGRERGCHVVYDLGSGALYDFAASGIAGEEAVATVLSSGVDCVTMSGDKLLGGLQAGLIVGKGKFLAKIRQNPLRRALRVDKVTIAALQALMRSYLFGDPRSDVPVVRDAVGTVEALRARGEKIIAGLPKRVRDMHSVTLVEDVSAIGGGSFACEDVPSVAIAIICGTEQDARGLARRMRGQAVPILSRIKANEVRVNLRSILPYEDDDLLEGLKSVLAR